MRSSEVELTLGTPRRGRIVPAVHSKQEVRPDPEHEVGLREWLKATYSPAGLVEACGRFANGDGAIDALMRERLLNLAHRDAEASPRISAKYRELFQRAVLRWSWQSANNRTIAIFLACLVGHPVLYFLHEIFVLNAALYLMVQMNRRQTAAFGAWIAAQG